MQACPSSLDLFVLLGEALQRAFRGGKTFSLIMSAANSRCATRITSCCVAMFAVSAVACAFGPTAQRSENGCESEGTSHERPPSTLGQVFVRLTLLD